MEDKTPVYRCRCSRCEKVGHGPESQWQKLDIRRPIIAKMMDDGEIVVIDDGERDNDDGYRHQLNLCKECSFELGSGQWANCGQILDWDRKTLAPLE